MDTRHSKDTGKAGKMPTSSAKDAKLTGSKSTDRKSDSTDKKSGMDAGKDSRSSTKKN